MEEALNVSGGPNINHSRMSAQTEFNLVELNRADKKQTKLSQATQGTLSRDYSVTIHHQFTQPPPKDKQLPRPVNHVRVVTVTQLAARLNHMFDAIDDTLFELADRAQNTEEQTLYFNGMRELRSKRRQIGHQFKNRLNNLFDALIHPDNSPLIRNEDGETPQVFAPHIGAEALAVMVRIVSEARAKLATPLLDIQQRLDSLVPSQVSDHNNPLDPQQICDAFIGMAEMTLKIDKKINLLILGQFYRHVIAHLPRVLKQANHLFSTVGVMPRNPTLNYAETLSIEQTPHVEIEQIMLRDQVSEFLSQRLTSHPFALPKIAIELFQGPWWQVMLRTAQQSGLRSQEWEKLCEFTDRIMESLLPERALQDRADWLHSLSGIVQGMRSYLGLSNLSEQELTRYLSGFEEAHRQVLDILAMEDIMNPTCPLTEKSASTHKKSTPMTHHQTIPAAEMNYFIQQVQQIPLHSWIEYATFQGTLIRCKLVEKNHQTHLYTFVNKRGEKVLEQEVYAIAQALRKHHMRILKNKPLLHRAFSYLKQSFKETMTEA